MSNNNISFSECQVKKSAADNRRDDLHYLIMATAASGRTVCYKLYLPKFGLDVFKFIVRMKSLIDISECNMLTMANFFVR